MAVAVALAVVVVVVVVARVVVVLGVVVAGVLVCCGDAGVGAVSLLLSRPLSTSWSLLRLLSSLRVVL